MVRVRLADFTVTREGSDARRGQRGRPCACGQRLEDSRGPQRPREGATGNSNHTGTNLGHIYILRFFDPKISSFFGFEWVIWA